MQVYVDGAMFNDAEDSLVLIRKNKPDWQFNKLNFVGGKVEKDEDIPQAMAREFKEETGIATAPGDWATKLSLISHNWIVYFLMTHGDISKARTMESEEVSIVEINNLQNLKHVPNLRWIIPMLLDHDIISPVAMYYTLQGT